MQEAFVFKKKTASIYIVVQNEDKLRACADSYTRAARPRTIQQVTTMANVFIPTKYARLQKQQSHIQLIW